MDQPGLTIVEQYRDLQRQRKTKQREAVLLEQKEKALAEEIINNVRNGANYGPDVTVVETEEPAVTDWPAFLYYVKNTGAVDLFEKRLMKSAVKGRLAEGILVDGVSFNIKYTLKA